jgi:hypothetical protein
MTNDDDTLESELAGLQPREVSSDLRQRIAVKLTEPRPWRQRQAWRLAAVGALVAASIAALLLVRVEWSANRQPVPVPGPAGDSLVKPDASALDTETASPSLLVYSRVLARSPEELEALLDRHGRLGSPAGSEMLPVAFTRPDDPLHPLLGEL